MVQFSFRFFQILLLSLTDSYLNISLCLDIKSQGFKMQLGAQNAILIYMIYYKVMNSVVPDMKKDSF